MKDLPEGFEIDDGTGINSSNEMAVLKYNGANKTASQADRDAFIANSNATPISALSSLPEGFVLDGADNNPTDATGNRLGILDSASKTGYDNNAKYNQALYERTGDPRFLAEAQKYSAMGGAINGVPKSSHGLQLAADLGANLEIGAINVSKIPNQIASYLTDPSAKEDDDSIWRNGGTPNNIVEDAINSGSTKAMKQMTDLQDQIAAQKSNFSRTPQQNIPFISKSTNPNDLLPWNVTLPSISQASSMAGNVFPSLGLFEAGGLAAPFAESVGADIAGQTAARAAGYGVANASISAPQAYEDTYNQAYADNIKKGMNQKEADSDARLKADKVMNEVAPIATTVGAVGGKFAPEVTGSAPVRFIKGSAVGAIPMGAQGGAQYIAQQNALGKPIDPYELASQVATNAVMAAPMEGGIAVREGKRISKIATDKPAVVTPEGDTRATPTFNPATGEMEVSGNMPTAFAGDLPVDVQARIEPTFTPQLSPNVDIDTVKTTLDAIKSGDVEAIHPDTMNDLQKTGEIAVDNNNGQPTLSELGNKLLDEIDNIGKNNAQPLTQEQPKAAAIGAENRAIADQNASASESKASPVLESATPAEEQEIADAELALPHQKPIESLNLEEARDLQDYRGYLNKHHISDAIDLIEKWEQQTGKKYNNNYDNVRALYPVESALHDQVEEKHNQLKQRGFSSVLQDALVAGKDISPEILNTSETSRLRELLNDPTIAAGQEKLSLELNNYSKNSALTEKGRKVRDVLNDKLFHVEQASPEEEKMLSEYQQHKSVGDVPFSVTPSDKFIAQKDQLKAQLTNIIKRINPDVKTEFADRLFGEGEAIKASGGKTAARQEVAGWYDKLDNLIKISTNSDKWNPLDSGFHEAIHSVTDMLHPSDAGVLKKAYPGTENLSQNEHQTIELAKILTDKNMPGIIPAVKRIASKIGQALRDIGRVFKLGKFNSINDIANRIERGSVYSDYQKALKSGDVESLKRLISADGMQYKADGNKFTEAFKKWFGDSKVVDDKGEPMVVYHGTDADIHEFKPSDKTGAIFFSDSPEYASSMAQSKGYGNGDNVIPAHLKVENPKIINAEDYNFHELEKAQMEGHDALIAQKDGNPHYVVAVFDPTQIKSAIGNNGNYDPKDPRIAYKASEENLSPEQQEQAIKEVSPALHEIVYSTTPKDDLEALKDVSIQAHGTPEEKAQSLGNRVYSAVDSGLNSLESTKEKMLRATVDLVKPIIPEKVYENAKNNIEHSIAMTKRNSGTLNVGRTVNDLTRIITNTTDGFGRSIAAKFKSPWATKIMDMFHSEPGKDRSIAATYHEDIADFYNKTMSRVANLLHNTKSAADKEAIRNYMTNPASMTAEATKSGNGYKAAHLAYEIQEMRKHLAAAGYEVPEVEGFYPRIYDTDFIVRNEANFKRDARLAYLDTYKEDLAAMSPEEREAALDGKVNSWYNNILLQDDGITSDPNQYFRSTSTTPSAPSSFKARTLSKAADDILAQYMVRDPMNAMNKLTMQTARKAAWEKRFGGTKLQEIHAGLVKDGLDSIAIGHMMDIIRANTGQLGGNISPTIKNGLALARYWTAVSYLTKAPFKHLSIALNVGTQTGNMANAWRAFYDGLHAFVGASDKARAMKTMGELAGVYGEAAEHSLMMNQTGQATDNAHINWLNKQYFKAVGMTHLVGSFKLGMMRSIQYYIGDLAEDVISHKNGYKSAEFMIKNYGIPAEEVRNFSKWVMDGGGAKIQQSIMLDNSPYSKMYQLAQQRAVNQMISNPTAATRQMYASHPVGGVIMQMTAYHMAFMKNTMERNARMFKEGLDPSNGFDLKDRVRMLSPMAMTIPVVWAFAAAYNAAKNAAFPPDKEDKNSPAIASFLDSDFFGQFNGLMKTIAGTHIAQKKFNYKYHAFSNNPLGADASLATSYGKMIGNFFDNWSPNPKSKAAELKAEYNLLVAPITTAVLSKYNAFAIPTFLGIQAINHPSVRRFVTGAKQPK